MKTLDALVLLRLVALARLLLRAAHPLDRHLVVHESRLAIGAVGDIVLGQRDAVGLRQSLWQRLVVPARQDD